MQLGYAPLLKTYGIIVWLHTAIYLTILCYLQVYFSQKDCTESDNTAVLKF